MSRERILIEYEMVNFPEDVKQKLFSCPIKAAKYYGSLEASRQLDNYKHWNSVAQDSHGVYRIAWIKIRKVKPDFQTKKKSGFSGIVHRYQVQRIKLEQYDKKDGRDAIKEAKQIKETKQARNKSKKKI